MYKFQKNDLVVCKPPEDKRNDSNINFELYARVADVDREKDILYLDIYIIQWCIHTNYRISQDLSKLSLTQMEHAAYYRLMNDDEIMLFHDRLSDFINARHKNYLCSPDVQTTLDIVNKAIKEQTAKKAKSVEPLDLTEEQNTRK